MKITKEEIMANNAEDQIAFILYKAGLIDTQDRVKVIDFQNERDIRIIRIKESYSFSWTKKTIKGIRINLDWMLRVRHGNDTYKSVMIKDGALDLDTVREKIQEMVNLAEERNRTKENAAKQEQKRIKERATVLKRLGLKPEYNDCSKARLKFGDADLGFDFHYLPGEDAIKVEIDTLTEIQVGNLITWFKAGCPDIGGILKALDKVSTE